MDNRVRACVAEFIGVFAVVFFRAGTACVVQLPSLKDHPTFGLIAVALAEGFALAVALTVTLSVSGGFLNPAVTLMLWVFKRVDGMKALGLVAAQITGAVLAGAVLRLIGGDDVTWMKASQLGTPHLNPEIFGVPHYSLPVLAGGIAIEGLFAFLYTFAIFGTILDRRAPRLGGLGAGLAQAAIVLAGFHITGGAANPVVWLGPVVWAYTVAPLADTAFADHPVYWMGPILGALLAGGLYIKFILPEEKDEG
jgi:glycerol uptake facilitator-like aquaporin